MDDRFSTIIETIHDGRRIYENIRKAVSYIFTIHIPIALSAVFMPILRILPDALFLLPAHIMLLELLIDPTCSLVLERLPAQPGLMEQSPRKKESSLLSHHLLGKSLFQGLVLFLVSFGSYVFYLNYLHESAASARSMGLCILMTANFFLVLLFASDRGFTFRGLQSFLRDRVLQFSSLGTFFLMFLTLNSPLSAFLKLSPLPISQFFLCVFLAAISVFWYEPIKRLFR
jgi:Ca2+-transporting ATPase